jgi:multiple sugar transport system ATP-binding protein
MGRAIVRQPAAFLMDEPLSNLDAKLRVQMRGEIARLQQDLGVTTIYVTHDQVEAMTMGDRVAVMRKGELQQVASPQELYDRPVNLFVGGFIGSPAMNMLAGTVEADGDGLAVRLGDQRLRLGGAPAGLAAHRDRQVVVGIRPEHLEDAAVAGDAPDGRTLQGTVALREALGSEIMVHLDVDVPAAATDEVRELAEDAGASGAAGGDKTTVVGRFSPRSAVGPGDPVRAVVDTTALHFFDPDTGLGIYDDTKGPTP